MLWGSHCLVGDWEREKLYIKQTVVDDKNSIWEMHIYFSAVVLGSVKQLCGKSINVIWEKKRVGNHEKQIIGY